ncbi:hypothetical protein L218DRAFT_1035817 [Marasmius fiardii PR-910]|nr:hypothetical protein L218DRAFT_1035817 [Marasmius fiardii PR-910]
MWDIPRACATASIRMRFFLSKEHLTPFGVVLQISTLLLHEVNFPNFHLLAQAHRYTNLTTKHVFSSSKVLSALPHVHTQKACPSSIASNTGPASAEHSPAESVPASPLTPIQEDMPEAPEAPVARVVIPPHAIKDLTVANCGWHDAQQTEYRAHGTFQSFARAAVHAYLNIKKTLNAQEQEARDNAIKAIEDKVPSFKNHEGHWGAVIVLKDQLKSQKDIAVKRSKRAAMKKQNAGSSVMA